MPKQTPKKSKPRIGFIGLGIMGAPMAGHLLAAGYEVSVFSRTRAKARPLERAGAKWHASPAETARDADVLLTMVTDTPDVESVLFGAHGVAEGLKPGAVVVDMTTASPEAARTFQQRLAQRGVQFLDAPVTGGDIGAKNGTLTIMVGGNPAALKRVRPVLECFAKKVVHVGDSGAGQLLKACNQILCSANLIGVCEAITLARRSGIDPRHIVEDLAAGAGGSWTLSYLGDKINKGDLNPAFMIRLMQKDLRIAQQAAQSALVPLPGTALAQQLFRAVEAQSGENLGTQAMIRAYEAIAVSSCAR